MLNEDSITQLKGSLRGRLIQPGDADYDEARKVYNGMIHKKPRLIALSVTHILFKRYVVCNSRLRSSQTSMSVFPENARILNL